MPKKQSKHEAEQLVSPVIDPPLRLSLTVTLKPDTARLWRTYEHTFRSLQPSASQIAAAMITAGLEQWAQNQIT